MSTRHDIKAGDTPTLSWDLGRDLTGWTCRLLIASETTGTVVVDTELVLDIDDAAVGIVRWTPAVDTLAVGSYDVEIETTAGGVVLTHPSTGRGQIGVARDLG